MNSSIKQKIAEYKQKLAVAETPLQEALLKNKIKGLEDCANNKHVFTELYSLENHVWESSHLCHYCGLNKLSTIPE